MEKPAQEQKIEADCDSIRRYALEYLDGELDEPLAVAIRIHIEVCDPCGRRMTFEAAFLRTLSRGRKFDPLPESLEERCVSIMREWRRGDA